MELIEFVIQQESSVKLVLVLCSVRLEMVHKNIVCKNDTIAKGSIQCVCIHACVLLYIYIYIYIYIYMLEVTNVKNSVITMIEFR
jgi:hypothetical protein